MVCVHPVQSQIYIKLKQNKKTLSYKWDCTWHKIQILLSSTIFTQTFFDIMMSTPLNRVNCSCNYITASCGPAKFFKLMHIEQWMTLLWFKYNTSILSLQLLSLYSHISTVSLVTCDLQLKSLSLHTWERRGWHGNNAGKI